MKTKGLSRGEILVGMEQGVFKDGDSFTVSATSPIKTSNLLISRANLMFADEDGDVKNTVFALVSTTKYDLVDRSREFWRYLDREIDEYKVGDIVTAGRALYSIANIIRDGQCNSFDELVLIEGTVQLSCTARSVRLVCPVESRLDTKG